MRHRNLLCLLVVFACQSSAADDYPRPEAILKEISATSTGEQVVVADTPEAKWKADVESYQSKQTKLSPEQSATTWLDLFDRQAALAATESGQYAIDNVGTNSTQTFGLGRVLKALPPPAHWQALNAAIKNRKKISGPQQSRDLALRLMGVVLANDIADRARFVDELKESSGSSIDDLLAADESAWAVLLGDQAASTSRLRAFETMLRRAPQSYETLLVPDLVKSVGEEKASFLLEEALTKTSWVMIVTSGKATKRLARELALKNIDKLKVPQWPLIDSTEAVDLYEALDKKFPAKKAKPKGLLGSLINRFGSGDDNDPMTHYRQMATTYYLLTLIRSGRIDEAIEVAGEIPSEESYQLTHLLRDEIQKNDEKQHIFEFVARSFAKNPSQDLCDAYITLAAELGKSTETVDAIKKALGREDLAADVRHDLQHSLARAQLAANQIDEGIETLRAVQTGLGKLSDRQSAALQIAKLGIALKRPDLTNQAIIDLFELTKKPVGRDQTWQAQEVAKGLAEVLVEIDRGPEAVRFLTHSIQGTLQSKREGPSGTPFVPDSVRPLLVEVLSIYDRANRPTDVVELLDTVPYWGRSDLAKFLADNDANQRPVGYLAAAALAGVDRKEEALRITEALLDINPGFDPAYRLITRLLKSREAAIAKLDELFAADQFEERPLIWKADLLRLDGKLDEAHATIQKAISIDPSDGEQPRGDRMRAYSVLAAILDAQGKVDDARLYRDVVQAIRTAEDADRLSEAGLLLRAIDGYRRSLELFRDAYCIQSRIAVQLAQSGNLAEAEQHYRKAYELMPDSFGRIESHCFGCEGAFRGPFAQGIAAEVFTRLLKANPKKPQLHYLLAYLRIQQNRPEEALESLQEAVRLDPDYVNAWKSINEVSGDSTMSASEREAAVLNLIRLDPGQRHTHPNFAHVRDLQALWNVFEATMKFRKEPPATIYPLQAATAREKTEMANQQMQVFDGSYDRHARSPIEAVLSTPAFAVLIGIMETQGQR